MRDKYFDLVDEALEHYKTAEGLCYRMQDLDLSIPYSCLELSKSVMSVLNAFISYYCKEPCTNICDAYKLVSTECPAFGTTLWLRNNVMLLDSWMFQEASISRSELKFVVFNIKAFLEKNGISTAVLSEKERSRILTSCSKRDYYLEYKTDSVLRITERLLYKIEDKQLEFCPAKYFEALNIKDEDAEMLRLTEVYKTSDAEVLLYIMKSIYEFYMNTQCC